MAAGDFCVLVPAGGDCYVIKSVLHDFSDAQCVKLLANCRDAMSRDGRRVIANQRILTSIDGPHFSLTVDVRMIVLLTGRERTEDDWRKLLGGARHAIGQGGRDRRRLHPDRRHSCQSVRIPPRLLPKAPCSRTLPDG